MNWIITVDITNIDSHYNASARVNGLKGILWAVKKGILFTIIKRCMMTSIPRGDGWTGKPNVRLTINIILCLYNNNCAHVIIIMMMMMMMVNNNNNNMMMMMMATTTIQHRLLSIYQTEHLGLAAPVRASRELADRAPLTVCQGGISAS